MAEQREPLPELDPAILRGPVREALGSDLAEPVDWQARALQGGATRSTSVYRVAGRARARGATLPWSLVLKVCRPRAGGDDPSRWNYWKREPLAYHSGLLRDLPGGVVAPRWFGNVERPDGAIWLWLEDVAGVRERPWPIDDFGRAARRLGRFNGAYLAGRPLPAAPWLGRGRLRAWVAFCAPAVAALPRHLAHPLVRGRFADATVSALRRLWVERETFLDALERLPRTFCHLDAFPRNLVVRRDIAGDDRLVALDWAGAGIGAVGEELAPWSRRACSSSKPTWPRRGSSTHSPSRTTWPGCGRRGGRRASRLSGSATPRRRPCGTVSASPWTWGSPRMSAPTGGPSRCWAVRWRRC